MTITIGNTTYDRGAEATWVDCDAADMRHALNRIERIATDGRKDPAVRLAEIEQLIMKLDGGAK